MKNKVTMTADIECSKTIAPKQIKLSEIMFFTILKLETY